VGIRWGTVQGAEIDGMARRNLAGLLAKVGASGREALGIRLGGRWARSSNRSEATPGDDGPAPAAPGDPIVSVIDCGAGLIKAIVVEPDRSTSSSTGVIVRGIGVIAMPDPPSPGAEIDRRAFMDAVEAALRAAEDIAGVVPRRTFLAVPGAHVVVTQGEASVSRMAPHVQVTDDEVLDAMARAQGVALDRARTLVAADRGEVPTLETVIAALFALTIDGRRVTRAAGLTGARLGASLAVAATEASTIADLRTLATYLDLELVGLLAVPAALGASMRAGIPDAGAIVIDIGAGATTVAIVGPSGTEVAMAFPIGVGMLADHLASVTGLTHREARQAAWPALAPDGPPRADVRRPLRDASKALAMAWLDALEVRLVDVRRGRTLPRAIWICGGGALLADIRSSLDGRAWSTSLFDGPPVVSVLSVQDLPDLRMDASTPGAIPDAVLVPTLALGVAAVHGLSAGAHNGLNALVRRLHLA
jgi:hypothetical protein